MGQPILYQVVLEHVYLSVLLCVVGSAALVMDDRGGTVVLVFGGVGVEDVHGALFLGLWGLCLVLDLLLRLILREESVGFGVPYWGFYSGTAEAFIVIVKSKCAPNRTQKGLHLMFEGIARKLSLFYRPRRHRGDP